MASKNLEGLLEIRGLAAFIVVFSHIDQFHDILQISSINFSQTEFADYAVTIFFVLSGFLITHLLLLEKGKKKSISIKKFYFRRVLRIWPAYFLTILLSLLLIISGIYDTPPLEKFRFGLPMMAFMLPNVAYVLNLTIAGTSPLWSIGVEEQFYLIWPWIVSKTNNLLRSIYIISIAYILLKIITYLLDPNGGLYALIKLTRIDCMAFGGIFALIWTKYQGAIFHPMTQFTTLLILISPLVVDLSTFAHLNIEFYAVASAIWVTNSAFNPKAFICMNSGIFRFLGKFSYGIYVHHLLLIYLISSLSQSLNSMIVHALILGATLATAMTSYYLVELPFLKIKKRFA